MGVLARTVEWLIVRLTAEYDKLDAAETPDWRVGEKTPEPKRKVHGLRTSGVR